MEIRGGTSFFGCPVGTSTRIKGTDPSPHSYRRLCREKVLIDPSVLPTIEYPEPAYEISLPGPSTVTEYPTSIAFQRLAA